MGSSAGDVWKVVEGEAGMLAEGFFLFCGLVQSLQAGRHQAVTAPFSFHLGRVQLIAEAHQLIHPLNNAVLLGEGRERER